MKTKYAYKIIKTFLIVQTYKYAKLRENENFFFNNIKTCILCKYNIVYI